MKRILAFLIALLFPVWICFAATDTLEGEELTDAANIEGVTTTDTVEGQVLKAAAATSSPCATCTSDPGDVLCEDHEAADAFTCGNWTEAEGANCTVSRVANPAGFSCDKRGDYAVRVLKTDTDDDVCGAGYEPAGVDSEVTYTEFHFRMDDLSTLGEGDFLRVVAGSSKEPFDLWKIRIRQTSSTNYISLWHKDKGANDELDDLLEITAGVWYRVRVRWDQNEVSGGVSVYIAVDDGNYTDYTGSISDTGTRAFPVDDIHIGAYDSNHTEKYDLYVTNIMVDDDTFQGAGDVCD